jgi:hypothetical protein
LETKVQLGQAKLRDTAFNDYLYQCYIWKFNAVLDNSYQCLQIPNPLNNNFRQQAHYAIFNLTIDDARRNLGYPIADDQLPKPQSNKVTIILPHTSATAATGSQPNAPQLDSTLDHISVTNFATIFPLLLQHDIPLQIGILDNNFLSEEKFTTWRDTLY